MRNTIEINGQTVKVLAEGIKKFGREWTEIEEFPMDVKYAHGGGTSVHEYSEDWVVIEQEKDFKLFMNNNVGYLVLVEFEIDHYEDNYSKHVVDRPGRILYTNF